jgi:glyoxylase-like metal-dependent hydrolase (beta-lactamase superfamily II)
MLSFRLKTPALLSAANSVLIIGSDGAVIFDSGHVPSVTKKMIADITRLTNKPVRFLVNTHWHPDHVSGNSLYGDRWPGVAIVSTPSTQFELTRPDSLYDDLTEMNKYMPAIEKALADAVRVPWFLSGTTSSGPSWL